jgi:hypothetical protein
MTNAAIAAAADTTFNTHRPLIARTGATSVIPAGVAAVCLIPFSTAAQFSS